MNIPFADKMMGTLMEKMNVPKLDDMFGGYEFKDGKMMAGVEYAMLTGDIELENGFVVLRAAADVNVTNIAPVYIPTTLSLMIKPPSMMFKYFLKDKGVVATNSCIIMPNMKQVVDFTVISGTNPPVNAFRRGDIIGYGYFTPIVPINNIAFTKQDAT